MTLPVDGNTGSNSTAAGAITTDYLPTADPDVDDLAFIVISHRDNALGTPTPADTADFGPWEQVDGSPVVQGASRLTVWKAVVESATPTAPTISDSGDHQQVRMFYVSHPDGTPHIHITEPSVDATSDTSGVAPCPDTPVNDCLVFLFAASDTPDANGTSQYSSVANASLSNVEVKAQNSVATGGGSAKLLAVGEKAVAGTVADWTYTKANAGVKSHLVVVVGPPPSGTTYFGDFSLGMTLDREFDGQRLTFGEFDLPLTVDRDFDAIRQTFGEFDLPLTVDRDFDAIRQTFGEFSLPLTFDADFSAIIGTYGEFALPIIFDAEFDGESTTGPQTKFGDFHLDLTLDREFDAVRSTFSGFALPIILGAVFDAERTAFSEFSFPIIFDSNFGPVRLTAHGNFDLALTLGMDFVGYSEMIGIILNNAEALYLGDTQIEAVYVGSEQVWP